MKRNFIILFVSIAALFTACVGESPTVIPDPAKQAFTGTEIGTSSPQLTGTYPENLDTDIPVDADIVMVFSKPMNPATFDTITVTITDGVSPVTNFNVSTASGGRAIIIDITAPAELTHGANYTVSITTGIQDTDVLPLEAGTSWTFTAASSTAGIEAPRVITGTQYPTGGTVPVTTSYAEVTFTRDMNAGTIDHLTTFYSTTGIDVGITPITAKTFRLDFNPANTLAYATLYQVFLTASIEDTDGNTLTPFNWTFTTEANPDPAPGDPLAISSLRIDSVSATGAVVSFTTNRPVAKEDCYAMYGTIPVTLASNDEPEDLSTDLTTVHTVTITGLTESTRYYLQAGLDTDSDGTVDYLSGTDLVFYTKTAAVVGVNEPATTAAGNQNGLVTVQNNNGTGYAFWVDGGADIYGEFFKLQTAPAGQWGPGGTQVNSAANMSKVVAISDGFTDAIAIYRDTADKLYARAVYNDGTDSLDELWAEQDLGLTTKTNSSFSACLVHERPSTIASGIADMPNDGAAADLLFDKSRDFSSIGFLDVGDMLAVADAGINWKNGIIETQGASPFSVFKFVLKSTAANPGLAALTNYYVLDADTVISGSNDAGIAENQIRSTATNLLPVMKDDIIRTSDGTWGKALNDGAWDGGGLYWYVNVDRNLTGFTNADTFTIYINYSGPHNSQAVANPFWDNDPATLFNPGTTVLKDDYVINMTSSPAKASTVTAIDPAEDSNYALQLVDANIMLNAESYTIRRLPTSSTYKAVGINTSTLAHGLVNSTNPFGAGNVGDIVMNLTTEISAMITGFTDPSTVSLSADIFTAIGQRYIVYTKRSYLVAYIDDVNDYVLARSFNYATGAAIGAVFPVQTAGVNSNPVAVSDGAGNAIIFYERGGTIFARKVSATGAMLWAGEATILAGFSIVQALPDRAITGTGGAYLLTENGAGTIRMLRVNSAGGITFNLNFPGYDPHMVTDTITGTPDRVIIAYRVPHTVVASIYYHIEARAYTGAGALTGPVVVSSSIATYHCEMPRVALADTGAGTSAFYVSWFDGRYIAYIGYSLYAMRYNAVGVADGTFNTGTEVFVTSPGSSGYLNELLMHLLFWDDDGVSPFGIIPIWLDYRGAGTDIYYENIDDTGSF